MLEYNVWSRGQAVKTPPFHGGIRGSIPLGTTIQTTIYIVYCPFPPFECLSEIAQTFEKQNLPHKIFKDGEVLVEDTITKNEVIYGK